jgi:hypothetical protein
MTPAERHAEGILHYGAKLAEHTEAVTLLGLMIASELRRSALLHIEPRPADDLLLEAKVLNGATMQVVMGQIVRTEEALN